MNRTRLVLMISLAVLIVSLGCSSSFQELPLLRQEIEVGDRQREWALVYFQSWRQHKDGSYLILSRQHMASAVELWFRLQLRIGHSYPDFYLIDKRRRKGCEFLDEIDRLALKFNVPVFNLSQTGCLSAS